MFALAGVGSVDEVQARAIGGSIFIGERVAARDGQTARAAVVGSSRFLPVGARLGRRFYEDGVGLGLRDLTSVGCCGRVGCLEMTPSLYFLGPMLRCFLVACWACGENVWHGSVPPAAAGWAARTNGFRDGCRGRGSGTVCFPLVGFQNVYNGQIINFGIIEYVRHMQ